MDNQWWFRNRPDDGTVYRDESPAPRFHRLRRLPRILWTIHAAWDRESNDGKTERWLEIWCREHGRFMVSLEDEFEALHTLPRPAVGLSCQNRARRKVDNGCTDAGTDH